VTGPAVAAFLILEPRFPRSVRYCVTAAKERIAALCEEGELPGEEAVDTLSALEGSLQAIAPAELHGARVHEILTRVVNEAHAVCNAIGSELLGYGPAQATQIQSQ
jgi:uncharacterized alpha-E superfamily protein